LEKIFVTESNLIRETKGPECCSVVGSRILHYLRLPSTNQKALEEAQRGAAEGLVIVAGGQTEGRGRRGRGWFSPGAKGLYFSILLKPRCRQEHFALLPLVAGIGVANGLEKLGVENVGVKWPNDVEINSRKVAGILVESRKIAGEMFAVVGIGLNVANREFPPELAQRATSLLLATGIEHTNDEVLSLLLGEIERLYSDLCLGRNDELVSELRRLDVLRGKQITVTAGEPLSGTAAGIDVSGGLLLETPDGHKLTVTSGEVELVRPANTEE
jgi:BirA family biotin operon repressor/biotin-[acetyl-CoA-carboxylase] ligase